MDCIFCRLINGELPSCLIHEDELVKVVLDINPLTNGHTLIISKEHYDNFLDLPEELVLHIDKITKKLYTQYKKKLGVGGFTIINNNDLGADVKHHHVHLIPRYSDDNFIQTSNKEVLKELSEITNKINN